MNKPNMSEILDLYNSVSKARIEDTDNFANGIATKLLSQLAGDPSLQAKFITVNPVDFVMGVEVGILYAQSQEAEAYA